MSLLVSVCVCSVGCTCVVRGSPTRKQAATNSALVLRRISQVLPRNGQLSTTPVMMVSTCTIYGRKQHSHIGDFISQEVYRVQDAGTHIHRLSVWEIKNVSKYVMAHRQLHYSTDTYQTNYLAITTKLKVAKKIIKCYIKLFHEKIITFNI